MKSASRYHQAGVGLVEVMIALLLSLFTIGVIIQVFLGNHRTFLITEAVARVQEESRFALYLMQKRAATGWVSGMHQQARGDHYQHPERYDNPL